MQRPKRSFTRLVDAEVVVLSGTANPELAGAVARELGVRLGSLTVSRFADGELNIHIDEPVSGRDVFVIQPTSRPVNDNLMELMLVIDGLRRGDAGRITAVIPYLGYQRQEKQTAAQDPISAKLVARAIEMAGADRAMIVDIHSPAIQGFFEIPAQLLSALGPFADHVRRTRPVDNLVVVSPDAGGVVRARALALLLESPVAVIDKRRPSPDVSEVVALMGDVSGRDCLIVDDIVSTGTTLINAAAALKARGARSVTVAVTHGVFAPSALDALQASPIDEVLVTNSVALPVAPEHGPDTVSLGHPKLTVVSIAPLIARAIEAAAPSRFTGRSGGGGEIGIA